MGVAARQCRKAINSGWRSLLRNGCDIGLFEISGEQQFTGLSRSQKSMGGCAIRIARCRNRSRIRINLLALRTESAGFLFLWLSFQCWLGQVVREERVRRGQLLGVDARELGHIVGSLLHVFKRAKLDLMQWVLGLLLRSEN